MFVRRLFLMGPLALIGLASMRGVRNAHTQTPADPFALNGHAWSQYSAEARAAFLAGFVAGAAAHQVTGGRTDMDGDAAVAQAVRLKREDRLHFPYAVNVYQSHLDDWYFYRNRRDEPLLQVLVDMNAVSRGGR